MKGKWYRSGFAKAALIIIAHVMAAAMTASFLWILSYPVLREELFEGNPAKKYEDSRNFIDQMLYYSGQELSRAGNLNQTEGMIRTRLWTLKIIMIREHLQETARADSPIIWASCWNGMSTA